MGRGFLSCMSLAIALAGCAAAQTAPPPASTGAANPGEYRVVRTFNPGGPGGWGNITLDPAARRLYIARTQYVMVLDSETGEKIGQVSDTPGVKMAIAVPELGKGFATNSGDSTCTVFDLKTFRTLARVPAGSQPNWLAYEPTSRRVFVCNEFDKSITVVDAADHSVNAKIDTGGMPSSIVADGRGKVLVTGIEHNELLRIDGKTMAIEARIPVLPVEEPRALTIDPASQRIFCAGVNAMLVEVDGATERVLGSRAVDTRVVALAFDPAEGDPSAGLIICPDGKGTLAVYHAEAQKGFPHVQTIRTAVWAANAAFDREKRRLYLPFAEYEPIKPGVEMPPLKPDSFRVIVVEAGDK